MSRPRRQYKNDGRVKKKPCGRKMKNFAGPSKYTNWTSPFLWSHIEDAALKAGKPWSPREIVRILHRDNPKLFAGITEQVVGRWIDPEARKEGISRWSDKVLARVAKGNSPGGQNTRAGILVRIRLL